MVSPSQSALLCVRVPKNERERLDSKSDTYHLEKRKKTCERGKEQIQAGGHSMLLCVCPKKKIKVKEKSVGLYPKKRQGESAFRQEEKKRTGGRGKKKHPIFISIS